MPNIFFNTEIFDSYQDFVLGGFFTDKKDRIDYNTIYAGVEDKINYLIKDYYLRAKSANMSKDLEYEERDAMVDIGLMLMDNLNYRIEGFDAKTIAESIMSCDQMFTWLNLNVKSKLKSYKHGTLPTTVGIVNKSFGDYKSEMQLYVEAKEAVEGCTLENFIEQLSLIEL